MGITLDDPQYDYYTEALGVVDRLRATAGDFYKKQVVSVFHGDVTKGMSNIRPTLINNVRNRWYGQHSYQNDAILQFFLSMVEYEGIVQIWREKFHHDLVRPTTVIKQWGNDTINTFGGDIDFNGPVDINARDFEALLPLMQSSPEFPSEHACYCTGVQELIDTFTTAQYGGTLSNIAFEALDSYIQILDLGDMVSKCSLGQIWGGFHFSDSVTAGYEKCLGLGDLAVEHMTDIVNLSNFNGGWNRGDTVPACPNR